MANGHISSSTSMTVHCRAAQNSDKQRRRRLNSAVSLLLLRLADGHAFVNIKTEEVVVVQLPAPVTSNCSFVETVWLITGAQFLSLPCTAINKCIHRQKCFSALVLPIR